LKLIDLKENLGKGGTVRQGMLLAGGTIRLFTDADNATTIDQFEAMMPFFKEGYDVVIGSRVKNGAKRNPPQPVYRQLMGRLGNLFFQLTLGLWGMWDTQCGFKAFTAEAAEQIFKRSRINGFGFDAEVLMLAKRMGYRTKEIPVSWAHDPRSHVNPLAYLKVFMETVTIRWWLWTKKYDFPDK
jgi:glycosyltransferase involved in cell wall biosynthesis